MNIVTFTPASNPEAVFQQCKTVEKKPQLTQTGQWSTRLATRVALYDAYVKSCIAGGTDLFTHEYPLLNRIRNELIEQYIAIAPQLEGIRKTLDSFINARTFLQGKLSTEDETDLTKMIDKIQNLAAKLIHQQEQIRRSLLPSLKFPTPTAPPSMLSSVLEWMSPTKASTEPEPVPSDPVNSDDEGEPKPLTYFATLSHTLDHLPSLKSLLRPDVHPHSPLTEAYSQLSTYWQRHQTLFILYLDQLSNNPDLERTPYLEAHSILQTYLDHLRTAKQAFGQVALSWKTNEPPSLAQRTNEQTDTHNYAKVQHILAKATALEEVFRNTLDQANPQATYRIECLRRLEWRIELCLSQASLYYSCPPQFVLKLQQLQNYIMKELEKYQGLSDEQFLTTKKRLCALGYLIDTLNGKPKNAASQQMVNEGIYPLERHVLTKEHSDTGETFEEIRTLTTPDGSLPPLLQKYDIRFSGALQKISDPPAARGANGKKPELRYDTVRLYWEEQHKQVIRHIDALSIYQVRQTHTPDWRLHTTTLDTLKSFLERLKTLTTPDPKLPHLINITCSIIGAYEKELIKAQELAKSKRT